MADWRDELPPEYKEEPSLKDYKDLGSLAKSHVELQKMIGSSIRPPGPDAAPEAKKEFLDKFTKQYPELVNVTNQEALLKALGKPEKPDGYTPPTELGSVPEDVVNNWRQTAAELGLTKKQAEAALKKQMEGYTQFNAKIEQSKSELKKEWGAALEERTRLAAVAAEKNGFPPEVVEVIRSGKGDAKQMIGFYNMAKALGMDQPGNHIGQQGPGGTPGVMSPLEVHARIAEIRARPEYFESRMNPILHEHLKNEVVKLYGMLPPEE